MELQGHVANGVVVLDGGVSLPEGAVVGVTYPVPPDTRLPEKQRVEFPLVRSDDLGTFHLTNERIHEIFEQEDIEAMKGQGNVPS